MQNLDAATTFAAQPMNVESGMETRRLGALNALELLDTDPEYVFDAATSVAARLVGAPIALVSLVDAHRQWFKSKVGLELRETPREHAFCAHAIRQLGPMILADASVDPRFRTNPLVTGEPGIRFYAGVPIRSSSGLAVGTLCVIDTRPRRLSDEQLSLLCDLAVWVSREIRIREAMIATRVRLADVENETQVLAQRNAELSLVLEHAEHACIAYDAKGVIVEWNELAERTFGHKADEALGQQLDYFLTQGPQSAREPLVGQWIGIWTTHLVGKRAELLAAHRDGSTMVVEATFAAARREDSEIFRAYVRDVTAQRALHHQAYSDPLTGLPNRRAFELALSSTLARADRAGRCAAALYIDLDGFKPVNDSLGHRAGDSVLQAVGRALRSLIRKTDEAFRVGGDEFAVLLEGLESGLADACRISRELIRMIGQTAVDEARQFAIGASIGIAVYEPGSGRSGAELIDEADRRMYVAKRSGRGRIFPDLDTTEVPRSRRRH